MLCLDEAPNLPHTRHGDVAETKQDLQNIRPIVIVQHCHQSACHRGA